MKLRNHRIEGIPFVPAKLTGGTITPTIVILHDTAGRLDKHNSRDYLATTSKASVHFVVERDGSISQLVATNKRAGHAGQSSYHGRRDCNDFSIGIEIVNPGRMTRGVGGAVLSWWGQDFGHGGGVGGYTLADITTPEHGEGVWMAYTPEQIEAVQNLLAALFAGIKTLTEARNIILLAGGEDKAAAVFEMVYGKTITYIPASFLQIPTEVTVYLDTAAASRL